MNVLIIGLGSIALKHINAIRLMYSKVVFYALRRSKQASKVEGVINIVECSTIDMSTIDFVIISNPTSEHYSSLKMMIKYKKPVFIEKPLFDKTDANTYELVKYIMNDDDIISYVACNLRFLDSLIKLKDILLGERINEVNAYCGSYLPDWRPDVDFRKVYSAVKELGGGVHIDLIHELDYMFWLFGEPKETRSYFRTSSSLKVTSFDYANYIWEYDDYSASIILNYYRKTAKRSLEIITSENEYKVNLLTNTIKKDGIIVFESKQNISDTYEVQLRYFIEKIMTGKEKFNQVDEAYKILGLCLN